MFKTSGVGGDGSGGGKFGLPDTIDSGVEGQEDEGDECALYLITFFLDTTLGVLVCHVILGYMVRKAREGHGWESWRYPGRYRVGRGEQVSRKRRMLGDETFG